MELNRDNFRAVIYYEFRRGLTQQQCGVDQLDSSFGDEATGPPCFAGFLNLIMVTSFAQG